jgi:hypothetical protein
MKKTVAALQITIGQTAYADDGYDDPSEHPYGCCGRAS